MNQETETGTALVPIQSLVPTVVFAAGGADPILEKLEETVRAVVYDVTTAQGREGIRSMAYKIARSKTALDNMGKDLGEEFLRKKQAIDAERRKIKTRLEALQEETRAPLTAWENRIAEHEAAINSLNALIIGHEQTVESVQERIDMIHPIMLRDWQEYAEKANQTADTVRSALLNRIAEIRKAEAEKAELERLRREEEARKQAEREAQIAAAAAAQAKAEAERAAEAARVEAERKAQETAAQIERERQAAEARAKAAEAAQALAEAKALQRAQEAEAARIAAEEKAARDAQAAAQAERDRIAAEKQAEAEAQKQREADTQHRKRINREALEDMVALGISEADAQTVIIGIAKGNVRNITIKY